MYPRKGCKQGEIRSDLLFSACYDDLVHDLESCGSGVLINSVGKYILLHILIYVDDIFLVSQSPYGLKILISKTFAFAY